MHLTTGRKLRPILLFAFCAMLLPNMWGCARKSASAPTRGQSGGASQEAARKISASGSPEKTGKNSTDKPATSPQPPGIEQPKLTVTTSKPTLVWTEKNQPRMTASASEATFNDAKQIGTLVDFSASLYENGKLSASVKAPQAIADTANRTVLATGGVTVKSLTRDTVVHAKWIKWYAKEQKVIGNGGVSMVTQMNGGKVTSTGAAFVADTAMSTIRIKSSSKGLQ